MSPSKIDGLRRIGRQGAINTNLRRYLLPIDYLYALEITAKYNAE